MTLDEASVSMAFISLRNLVLETRHAIRRHAMGERKGQGSPPLRNAQRVDRVKANCASSYSCELGTVVVGLAGRGGVL